MRSYLFLAQVYVHRLIGRFMADDTHRLMVKSSFLLFAGGMRGAQETHRGKRKEEESCPVAMWGEKQQSLPGNVPMGWPLQL